jgi:hypothetical protein
MRERQNQLDETQHAATRRWNPREGSVGSPRRTAASIASAAFRKAVLVRDNDSLVSFAIYNPFPKLDVAGSNPVSRSIESRTYKFREPAEAGISEVETRFSSRTH